SQRITWFLPVWPPPPDASNLLSGLNATLSTSPPCSGGNLPIGNHVALSHNTTVPSVLADASKVPSGLNATDVIRPVCCGYNWRKTVSLEKSHTTIRGTSPATARSLPSGVNASA